MAVSNSTPVSSVPSSALELKLKSAWIVAGSEVKKNGVTIKENYVPSLERLEVKLINVKLFGHLACMMKC
jgi:hypothetical protein